MCISSKSPRAAGAAGPDPLRNTESRSDTEMETASSVHGHSSKAQGDPLLNKDIQWFSFVPTFAASFACLYYYMWLLNTRN